MAMGPEDKKKVFAAGGLAGLLGIVGLIVWHPWSGPATSDPATPPTTALAGSAPGGSGAPPSSLVPAGAGGGEGGSAPAAVGGGGATGTVGASAQLVAAEQFRDDPFVPEYSTVPTPVPPVPTPTPRPTPRPTATPRPPIIIPQPGDSGFGLPGRTDLPIVPGGSSRTTVLAGLPSARISRLVNAPTAPRVQAPPVTPGGTDTNQGLERSPNKRLAGVAIGDSVRALLEIEDPITGLFRTFIVQPGQRIDAENLQVLRIERTTENNRTRVRMIVRENGQIRVIELREGQRPDIAPVGGGEGSSGGYPGSGGGYPGSGGGYPGSGRGGYPGSGRGGSPGGAGRYPGNASPPGFPGGRPGFGG